MEISLILATKNSVELTKWVHPTWNFVMWWNAILPGWLKIIVMYISNQKRHLTLKSPIKMLLFWSLIKILQSELLYWVQYRVILYRISVYYFPLSVSCQIMPQLPQIEFQNFSPILLILETGWFVLVLFAAVERKLTILISLIRSSWTNLCKQNELVSTHWGRDKCIFWNAFSWMKICEVRLIFHWI